MPSNNKAYLGEVKESTSSGSQKNGYKNKNFWSIYGIDADDDRHIRVRIPAVPGHRNFKSWKPIIDAIQKGYLVEITGFHYMIGKYAAKAKDDSPPKQFPDNIHGDAFTEHHATYRLIDKDNNYVEPESLEKPQPPSFSDLFDHPYKID
jgi:hypothetical protein